MMSVCNVTLVLLILGSIWPAVAQQRPSTGGSVLTVGDPRAANRIEVFYDLQCSTCASFHSTLKGVIDRHRDKVFVIFRHFPLEIHANAFMASSVAEAARRQGKGLEMIELLLDEQTRWSTSAQPYRLIFGYVDKLGLDRKRFKEDVISDDVIRTVVLDMNRAKKLAVASTPTVFLNGKLLNYSESLALESAISKGN